MITVYKYHSEPNLLEQYDNRTTIVPELAYYNAINTKNRFEAGERAIIKSPFYAYCYARDIIKGRWPEAEPTIIKKPNYAYMYTKYIIKGRWPEAEPTIMKDEYWWNKYKEQFGIQ